MSVGWVGVGETEMSYGAIPAIQDEIVVAAIWATGSERTSALFQMAPDYLAWRLPQDDPIRLFRQLGESGCLTPSESAQLAARLSEVAFALEETYRLISRDVYHWIESEERQLFDRCAYSVFWVLRECAMAAAQGKEIRWGE